MSYSVTDICNRALQKVGAAKINSIDENTPSARACNTMYDLLRRSLLRQYAWKFAIKQVQMAPDSTAPDFGFEASYTLPADYILMLPPTGPANLDSLDYVIQGGKLYTDEATEVDFRYIADIQNVSLMDPLFIEALACLMARELTEVLTQSNTKRALNKDGFDEAVAAARKASAFESVAQVLPDPSWVTIRE